MEKEIQEQRTSFSSTTKKTVKVVQHSSSESIESSHGEFREGSPSSLTSNRSETTQKRQIQQVFNTLGELQLQPLMNLGSSFTGKDSDFEDVSTQICCVEQDNKFEMKLDVQEYSPQDIQVKVLDDMVVVTGNQEIKINENNFRSRSFSKKFSIPHGVKPENIKCSLSKDGLLKISAPVEANALSQLRQTQTSQMSNVTQTQEQQVIKSENKSDTVTSISSNVTSTKSQENTENQLETSACHGYQVCLITPQKVGPSQVPPELGTIIDAKTFTIRTEIKNFVAEEIKVKVTKSLVSIEGIHESESIISVGGVGSKSHSASRSFYKEFTLIPGLKLKGTDCTLTEDGILTITIPMWPQIDQSVTCTRQEQKTQVTKIQAHEQKVVKSDSLCSNTSTTTQDTNENFLLTPTMDDDDVSPTDAQDVSKDICHVNDGDTFEMKLDVSEYKREEIQIKISRTTVTIRGKQETTNTHKSFLKKFTIPEGVKPEAVVANVSPNGVLTISAPIDKSTTNVTKEHVQTVTDTCVQQQKQTQQRKTVIQKEQVENEVVEQEHKVVKKDSAIKQEQIAEEKQSVPKPQPKVSQTQPETVSTSPQPEPTEEIIIHKQLPEVHQPLPKTPENKKQPEPCQRQPEEDEALQRQAGEDCNRRIPNEPPRPNKTAPQPTLTDGVTVQNQKHQGQQPDELSKQPQVQKQPTPKDEEGVENLQIKELSKPEPKVVKPDSKDEPNEVSQVNDGKIFKVTVNVSEYKIEELTVKIIKRMIIIQGSHEDEFSSRSFNKKIPIPVGVEPKAVTGGFAPNGVLVITSPVNARPSTESEEVTESTVTEEKEVSAKKLTTQRVQQVTQEHKKVTQEEQKETSIEEIQDSDEDFVIIPEAAPGDISEPTSPASDDDDVPKEVVNVNDGKTFKVVFNVTKYKREEIQVKVSKTTITIEGKHVTKFSSRSFFKEIPIPQGIKPETITSNFSPDGLLTITAPVQTSPSTVAPDSQKPKHTQHEKETTVTTEKTKQTTQKKQQITEQHEEIQQSEEEFVIVDIKDDKKEKKVVKSTPDEDTKQISQVVDDKTFKVTIDVSEYKREEIEIKVTRTTIRIVGKQVTKYSTRSFFKEVPIPEGVDPKSITSNVNSQGILTITATVTETQHETTKVTQQKQTQHEQVIQKEQVTQQQVTQQKNVTQNQQKVTQTQEKVTQQQQQVTQQQKQVTQQQKTVQQGQTSTTQKTQLVKSSSDEIVINSIIDLNAPEESIRSSGNAQVMKQTDDPIFKMVYDVTGYKPDEITIKITKFLVTVEGKQVTEFSSRSFFKKFEIPYDVDPAEIRSTLSSKGVLTLAAPRDKSRPMN